MFVIDRLYASRLGYFVDLTQVAHYAGVKRVLQSKGHIGCFVWRNSVHRYFN